MGSNPGAPMDPVDKAVWEMSQAIAKTNRRVAVEKGTVHVEARGIPGHYAVVYENPTGRWRVAYQRKAGRTKWEAVALVDNAEQVIAAIEKHQPSAN